MRTLDEMVAEYFGVLVGSPATREENKFLPRNLTKRFVHTPTDWHVYNSRTMLSRQPTLSLLYVLATVSSAAIQYMYVTDRLRLLQTQL